LATHAKGAVQSHHAALCAQNGGSDGEVEPATCRQGAMIAASALIQSRELWCQRVMPARLRLWPERERRSMSVANDQHPLHSEADDAWSDHGSDFVLIAEGKPPPRIELARERLPICRLYFGLLRTIIDDYGAEFATHSDSLAYRTIGIYVSFGLSCARPFAPARSRTR
jgi:hypothetical protein